MGKITDPWWRLLFVRLSKGPWIGQKLTLDYFVSRIFSSMDKLISFQEQKLLIFSLFWKGVQRKRRINYYHSRFNFKAKQIWNGCNIYDSAVSITCPLKTITDPLKEIKWPKQTQKRHLYLYLISYFYFECYYLFSAEFTFNRSVDWNIYIFNENMLNLNLFLQ